jgi:hypothetical protein
MLAVNDADVSWVDHSVSRKRKAGVPINVKASQITRYHRTWSDSPIDKIPKDHQKKQSERLLMSPFRRIYTVILFQLG